jgi:SAM-dependent methyltransferase
MSVNTDMIAAWDGPEGDHWAAHAEHYQASSARFRRALVDSLDLSATSAVLDIGCGTGTSTIDAGRVATAGSVLGVDLSARMLDVGRAAAESAGLGNVRFAQADAQVHPFPPAAHDVAFSCFGSMFFSDAVAAFANIRSTLRPGGPLVLLVWRDLQRNEWVNAVRTALAAGRDLPVPPPGAPGPFSLADSDHATRLLTAAGFAEVEVSSVDEPMTFGRDAEDAYAFVSTFGVTRGLTADLDEATRTCVLEQLMQTLRDHETPDGVQLAGSAWLIRAR